MEQLTLNMIPNGYTPTAHISQYDDGRHIRFNLQNINLAGNETVTLKIRKTNGELITKTIENHTSYVEYVSEKADCDYSGTANCEIVISKDNTVLGSKNFLMKVEADAYDGAGVVTETASGRIATFETNMVDVLQEVKCEINPTQDLHGYDHVWAGGAGKNILNYDVWKTTTIIRGSAIWENNGVTLTATERDAYTNYTYLDVAKIPVSVGDDIYISWQEDTNKDGMIYLFTSRNGALGARAFVNNTYAKNLHYTVTAEDEGFISFRFGVTEQGETISFKNIQINKGSQEDTWTPYANICQIIGIDELNISRTGVNLCDRTNIADGYIDDTTGEVRGGAYYKHTNYIPVVSGQKIYIMTEQTAAMWGAWYDKNKNYISGITNYSQTEATVPANACFIRLTCKTDDTGNLETFAVNYPSTSTYHAYNGDNIVIDLDGTRYGGNVHYRNGRWYFEGTKKKIVLDGNTPISDIGVSVVSGYTQVSYMPFISEGLDTSEFMSNIFESVPASQAGLYKIYPTSVLGSPRMFLGLPDSVTTRQEAVSWFSANPTEVVYELANPVTIELDVSEPMFEALLGINNVWHDGNGDTEVKYLFDA